MRNLAFCCAAVLLGCSRADKRPAETSTAGDTASSAVTPSPTISLSDFAGKWRTVATDDAGTVLGEAELRATADTSGWTLTFPKQKPIPLRVLAVAGDSVVTEAGPYRSTRQKGAQITTRAVNRLQDGKLVANLEGRYRIGGRDSTFRAKVEGTREP